MPQPAARLFHYTIEEVEPYINWTYFLHAWGLPSAMGRTPGVADVCPCGCVPAVQGGPQDQAAQAAQLFGDARQELASFAQRDLRTHALVSIVQACAQGDDLLLSDGERIPLLRQQHRDPDRPCLCLNDFVAPAHSARVDHVGLFLSTTDEAVEQSHPHDPYRHMLAQTLADRLAEACIERAHQYVRTTLWGYAPDEQLTPQQLFAERFQGIRPAVGYPSLPDQSLNFVLDRLLHFDRIGVRLTENAAMYPHASVSGLMFAHPAARYFSVGPIGHDQMADYARRRGMGVQELERFFVNRGA